MDNALLIISGLTLGIVVVGIGGIYLLKALYLRTIRGYSSNDKPFKFDFNTTTSFQGTLIMALLVFLVGILDVSCSRTDVQKTATFKQYEEEMIKRSYMKGYEAAQKNIIEAVTMEIEKVEE